MEMVKLKWSAFHFWASKSMQIPVAAARRSEAGPGAHKMNDYARAS
jgi:hypothetical protein